MQSTCHVSTIFRNAAVFSSPLEDHPDCCQHKGEKPTSMIGLEEVCAHGMSNLHVSESQKILKGIFQILEQRTGYCHPDDVFLWVFLVYSRKAMPSNILHVLHWHGFMVW